jgi:hypothetical protein
MRTVSLTKSGARLALLCLLPAQLTAQALGAGVVAGRVHTRLGAEEPRAAARVRVSIVGSTLSAVTNGEGRFIVAGVPAGDRRVRVQLLGYVTAEVPVRVTAGDTARLDVTLEPGAQLLAALNVAARANDPGGSCPDRAIRAHRHADVLHRHL